MAILQVFRLDFHARGDALHQVVVKHQPALGDEPAPVIEQMVADRLEGPCLEIGPQFEGIPLLPQGDIDLLQQIARAVAAGSQRADVGEHGGLVVGQLPDKLLG